MIGGTYPHRNHLSRLGLDDRWGVSASKLSEIRRSFDLEERWDPLRSKSSRSLDLLDLLLGLSIEGMTFTATSLSSGWVASSAIMARTPAPRTCVVRCLMNDGIMMLVMVMTFTHSQMSHNHSIPPPVVHVRYHHYCRVIPISWQVRTSLERGTAPGLSDPCNMYHH